MVLLLTKIITWNQFLAALVKTFLLNNNARMVGYEVSLIDVLYNPFRTNCSTVVNMVSLAVLWQMLNWDIFFNIFNSKVLLLCISTYSMWESDLHCNAKCRSVTAYLCLYIHTHINTHTHRGVHVAFPSSVSICMLVTEQCKKSSHNTYHKIW